MVYILGSKTQQLRAGQSAVTTKACQQLCPQQVILYCDRTGCCLWPLLGLPCSLPPL